MGQITIGEQSYNVVHTFTDSRAVIDYDLGAFVLVDKAPNGTWDLSGQPASPEEEVVIKALNAPTNDVTVVTVTKDS